MNPLSIRVAVGLPDGKVPGDFDIGHNTAGFNEPSAAWKLSSSVTRCRLCRFYRLAVYGTRGRSEAGTWLRRSGCVDSSQSTSS